MTNMLRVLIVEDSENDAQIVLRQLRGGGYDPKWERVDTAEAMRSALDREQWDVILCDYRMPRFDALAALKLIQEKQINVPFIIVSGTIGEDTAVAAMKSGAHDYLMKDRLSRLVVTIEKEIRDAEVRKERKRIEKELLESESKYRRLVDNANEAIIVAQDGRLKFVNRMTSELAGYSEQELMSMAFTEFIHPDDRDMVLKRYMSRLQGKYAQPRYEFRLVTRDGSVKWVEIGAVLIDWEGKPASLNFLTDITDRKKAEETLRKSEGRFRAMIENAFEGITIINADGVTVYGNPAVGHIAGITANEVIGIRFLDNVHPKDIEEITQTMARLAREPGLTLSSVFRIKFPDGSYHYIESISTNLVDNASVGGIVVNFRDITERKRTEEALRKSEERFRIMVENTFEGISIITTDGTTVYASPNVGRVMGISSEIVGTRFLDNMHPDEMELVKQSMARLVSEPGLKIASIFRIKFPDGSYHYIENTATNFIDNPSIGGIVINFRDITERKRTEKTLRESEEKYRQLIETLQEGVWAIDKDANTTFVNSHMAEMLGYAAEEMLGKGLFSFMDARGIELANYNIERRNQGISEQRDFEFICKDGKRIYTSLETSPLKDEKGNVVGALAGVIDITERKRAEEALRNSEEKLRVMFESMSDGVIVSDPNINIVDTNKSVLDILGLKTKEELIGRNVAEVVKFKNPEIVMTNLIKMIEERRLQEKGEYCLVLPSGKDIEVEVITSIMHDDDGHSIGFMNVIRDVTERKRAEERRLELERKYLINSRLASIGEMAAGVAHEINNPLSPIIGFADLLLKENLPEAVKGDLQIIRDCANRAANVTKGLLIFARQGKPMRKLYSINDVVETTLKFRAYHLKTNNIRVITELDPELPEIIVDAAQMQQVLLNIIMNAEYEMKKAHGSGNLTVITEMKDDMIRVLVKDDGQGISKEHMDKLFQPFFTTKKVGEGTGLGLSVCHGIVAEHNGRIWAESKEGVGATFILELPIVRQEEEEIKQSEPDAVEPRAAVAARILVVDDEPSIIQVLKRALTAEGYKVEVTSTAKEALKLIESGNRYALILLDIRMPGMSGIEMYEYLDKTIRPLTKRIIFVTGDVLGTDTLNFFSRTGASYITKPFDIEQLKEAIKSKLDQRV